MATSGISSFSSSAISAGRSFESRAASSAQSTISSDSTVSLIACPSLSSVNDLGPRDVTARLRPEQREQTTVLQYRICVSAGVAPAQFCGPAPLPNRLSLSKLCSAAA